MQVSWLNSIREWQEEFVGNMTSREFVDTITGDLLGSRVFVFTPKGEVSAVSSYLHRVFLSSSWLSKASRYQALLCSKMTLRSLGLLIDLKLVHMLSIAGEESAKGGNSH